MSNSIPNIPIYTNKSLILDLSSLLVEGYLESKSIKTKNEQEDSIRISLDYKTQGSSKDKSTSDTTDKSGYINAEWETDNEITLKRVYTTLYFFNNVRDILLKKRLLREITEQDIILSKVYPGEYVEFTSNLSTASLTVTISALIDILESYDTKSLDSLIKDEMVGPTNYSTILKQLKNINGYLIKNNTTDLIMNFNSAKGILSVNINNFSDKNAYIYDTAYSQCKTLCKVIKTIDKNNSIDLLRKTGISNYCCNFLNSLEPYLKILNNNGILIPSNFTTKITGPAIQVIPIAMYV